MTTAQIRPTVSIWLAFRFAISRRRLGVHQYTLIGVLVAFTSILGASF